MKKILVLSSYYEGLLNSIKNYDIPLLNLNTPGLKMKKLNELMFDNLFNINER